MTNLQEPQNTYPNLQKAAEVSQLMRALSHPQRLCLLCHLSDKSCTVTQLVEACGLPQPQVSHLLARLKLEGLIKSTRNGRFIVYEIADLRAMQVVKALSEIYCN